MKSVLKAVIRFVKDRRNLVLILFLVIALAVTTSAIKQVQFNYSLEQRARKLETEIAILDVQARNQQLKNEFYRTDYFQDLEARRLLGKSAEGETVLIVDKNDILSVTSEYIPPKSDDEVAESLDSKSNLELWLDFFNGKLL